VPILRINALAYWDSLLADLRDDALPLLRSAHHTLHALRLAATREPWRSEDLPSTLARLADDVAECRDLIARVTLSDLRDAVLPKLRSVHCLLAALSLSVARDMVLVEELPHALEELADKVKKCRDLIDRATCGR
jgi:hypothetical protein